MATRDWLYTIVKYTTGGLLVGAVGVGGLLYGFQTKLIYPAGIPAGEYKSLGTIFLRVLFLILCRPLGSRTVVATPDEFDMAFEDVRLRTPDGIQLRAYLMLQADEPSRKPTVLLLHANAGNVVSKHYRRSACSSSFRQPPLELIRHLTRPAGSSLTYCQSILQINEVQRPRFVLQRVREHFEYTA